jgi:hypothetical protein
MTPMPEEGDVRILIDSDEKYYYVQEYKFGVWNRAAKLGPANPEVIKAVKEACDQIEANQAWPFPPTNKEQHTEETPEQAYERAKRVVEEHS